LQRSKILDSQIQTKVADKSLETKITILIVGQKELMSWELSDNSNENPYKADGL
jgi:hypothetical protein